MKHFAVEIGKSQADINSAFQRAIADTLADEVKSNQITQAQADAIKKKLANQTPCALPAAAPHGGDTKRTSPPICSSTSPQPRPRLASPKRS